VGIYCVLAALITVYEFAFPTKKTVACSTIISDRHGVSHIIVGSGELYE
jgi:hypothetical protein